MAFVEATGIYFARYKVGRFELTEKLALVR
jgi:hypothetical protein